MFLCYGATIEDQFEFLTRRWSNLPNQPNDGGHDPVIGQRDSRGDRERFIDVPTADGSTVRITIERDWVVPTGGGYFFAPPISALTTVMGGVYGCCSDARSSDDPAGVIWTGEGAGPQDHRAEPEGPSRLHDPRHLRGRVALIGTEVKSLRLGRASLVTPTPPSTTARSGCAACTSPSTPKAAGPTTSRVGPASCCCTATRSSG